MSRAEAHEEYDKSVTLVHRLHTGVFQKQIDRYIRGYCWPCRSSSIQAYVEEEEKRAEAISVNCPTGDRGTLNNV